MPEASRVPCGSGPDLPLCSPADVLGSVPSGLGEALGSLCWLRAPRHTFGLSLGSALCTVGRQAAGTYLKLPSRRLFSRESSELLLCRRGVLFIGPGDFNDRQTDGAILVNEEDRADGNHVDPIQELTLSQYVTKIFGILYLTHIHIVMVNARRAAETEHV